MDKVQKITNNRRILIVIGLLIIIGSLSYFIITRFNNGDNNSKNSDNKSLEIITGGSYALEGEYSNITIDTKEFVELKLNNVTITSIDEPAINVLKSNEVSITLLGENKIIANTTEKLDSAIYSKNNLIFNGDGSLNIESNYNGIESKANITINGGAYNIKSTGDGINSNDILTINNGVFNINTESDGIHADGQIVINNGTLNINSIEGIEATHVIINSGVIDISASDDGINASNKSDKYNIIIEINGGNIKIVMAEGDTDGIDSNGDLIVTGGTIDVVAKSPFDYDGKLNYTGGTIIVNGTKTNEITNQIIGGPRMDDRRNNG